MKYLQQLGISNNAKPEEIKKLAAKDRRRRDRDGHRRTTNEGASKTHYGYKKSSGTSGGYKSHVDYNKQASYGASKHYGGSSHNQQSSSNHYGGEDKKYQDYNGHGQSYKYYKGSSGGTKKYYKKG